ncbi:ABC transporter ATP-binding protein [Kineosporia sp. R_H_3]|uniref:ABC transporter ATP-binding protein n=1 Tax=Kineosporia sp. R_H_3 TaxID=1961848 RepID=UPI0018EA2DAE|nr:ABC transporter ATP-binding protein [Kineosporia sp. R_H_3]
MEPLLRVEDLRVDLPTRRGLRPAVDGLSFDVAEGEIVGIAGESGSGKTMTAMTLLGLLPHGARTSGSARFDGRELLSLPRRQLRDLRGRQIAMVSQDPSTALHPILPVGTQVTEHMRHHLGLSKSAARAEAVDLLATVRIPDPERALGAYPGQFSGGMRQRIAIAVALAARPRLLLADEPTTALDVTVQAGILRLLDRLRRERGLAVLVITHDLGVMSAVADRVAVMYAGRLAESGPRAEVLARPRHPYTRGLLDALPHPEAADDPARVALRPIPGSPPSLGEVPAGCPFHPRCAFAVPACATDRPEPLPVTAGHLLACPPDPLHRTGAAPADEEAPA